MIIRKKSLLLFCVVIFALFPSVRSFGSEYSDGGYESDRGPRKYADPFASRANVSVHVGENPLYVYKEYYEDNKRKEWKKTFRKDGQYWVIDELPKGTIVSVPEGYKARCVSFHTKAVSGGQEKRLDNGRIIYSAGTNIKYTYPSALYLYKN